MELSDLWKKSAYPIKTLNELEGCMLRFGGVWKVYADGREQFVLRKHIIKDTLRSIMSAMEKGRMFYPESKVEVNDGQH